MEQRQIDLKKLAPLLEQYEKFRITKVLKIEGDATSIIARGEKKCVFEVSVWLECVIGDAACELHVWGLNDYEDAEGVEITKGATDAVKLVIKRDSQNLADYIKACLIKL